MAMQINPSSVRADDQQGASGSEPTISVVIAARDCESTIQRALCSALNQSSPADQVIVVDDMSADGTRKQVLQLFADSVAIVEGPGHGPATARNIGMQTATGAWVAFLDGDDYWEAEFLGLARSRIGISPDAVACFGAATPVDDSGRIVGRHRMRESVTLEELVRGQLVPTTSAALVHRATALGCGGFFEDISRAAEDLDLWLRMAAVGPCVGFSQAAAVYVVHDERDRSRPAALLAEMERDRELVIDRLAASGAPPRLVRRGRAVMRARTARYWLRAGGTKSARAAARASLRALPTLEGLMTLALASAPRALRERAVAIRRRGRTAGIFRRL
jgi:glycosyltransferase involved in cell wall biosynthesis